METTFQLAVFQPDQMKSATASVALARLKTACSANGWAEAVVDASGPNVYLDDVILFAGATSPEALKEQCKLARENGQHVIIVTDAIESTGADLHDTLVELNESLYQLSPAAAVVSLVKVRNHPQLFIYAFAKADCTATVLVLFDDGAEALVITRKHDPYKGLECFPGGFLNVQLEDLVATAARELKEETSIIVDPSELRLVDVRSGPSRDNRGHVVDHGFLFLVPADKKAAVLAQMKAGDDAGSAQLVPVAELLKRELAFDHKELLTAALRQIGK